MKHYVLLKLAQGADVDAARHKVWKALDKLDADLDWLNRPAVFRSCRPDGDADLMAVFEVDEEERLPEYLNHPARVKLAEALKDVLVSQVTFDHY